MTIRSKKHLPYRQDLNTVIEISPDEAGIFDLLFEDSLIPDPEDATRRDELDLILSTGVSAEHDVLEVEYAECDFGRYYEARVIGQPPDGIVSRWTVTFKVRE